MSFKVQISAYHTPGIYYSPILASFAAQFKQQKQLGKDNLKYVTKGPRDEATTTICYCYALRFRQIKRMTVILPVGGA